MCDPDRPARGRAGLPPALVRPSPTREARRRRARSSDGLVERCEQTNHPQQPPPCCAPPGSARASTGSPPVRTYPPARTAEFVQKDRGPFSHRLKWWITVLALSPTMSLILNSYSGDSPADNGGLRSAAGQLDRDLHDVVRIVGLVDVIGVVHRHDECVATVGKPFDRQLLSGRAGGVHVGPAGRDALQGRP